MLCGFESKIDKHTVDFQILHYLGCRKPCKWEKHGEATGQLVRRFDKKKTHFWILLTNSFTEIISNPGFTRNTGISANYMGWGHLIICPDLDQWSQVSHHGVHRCGRRGCWQFRPCYGRTVLGVNPFSSIYWYSRKLDLQCIHMGVFLNGGTPKTPQNDRKTHGCWVPPF